MPLAVQKFLPIRCELVLPTVDLAGARAILGLHENEIKDLVDTKTIPAWDISLDPAAKNEDGHHRRELRLHARSCRNWAEGKPIEDDEDKLILHLYGGTRPFIPGTRFFRAWNCDSGHAINLIAAKVLKLIAGTDYGQGRGNTPCITWASAVDFLKTRRLK
jgi:hypothetical protein